MRGLGLTKVGLSSSSAALTCGLVLHLCLLQALLLLPLDLLQVVTLLLQPSCPAALQTEGTQRGPSDGPHLAYVQHQAPCQQGQDRRKLLLP